MVRHDDDLALVRRVLAGDEIARETLRERMGCVPRFVQKFNFERGRPFAEEEVEDLVQQVHAMVWERLREFRGAARVESWMYRFAYFTFLGTLKRRRIEERGGPRGEGWFAERPSGDPGPVPSLAAREERELLMRALEELEPSARELLEMKHFEDLRFEDISARLETPMSTVKTRYYRALETLALRIKALQREAAGPTGGSR